MIWIAFFVMMSFFLAGCAEGIMDYLQFHYIKENTFWNTKLSWVNKWKDGNPLKGERFMFSSSLLVAFTDGWHLMKFVRNIFLFIGVGTLFYLGTLAGQIDFVDPIISAVFAIGLRGVYGVGFVMMYDVTLPSFD